MDAVRNGGPIPDEKLNVLINYTRKLVNQRGNVSDNDVQKLLDAGYTKRHVLEINIAVAMKTLSNYTNHITGTPVDEPFKDEELTFDKATV